MVRRFSAHELRMTLEGEGFEVVGVHGDLEGWTVSLDSPRFVAVARRV